MGYTKPKKIEARGKTVITFYCALYAEAQYLIQHYELKKDSNITHFQLFSNEKKDIQVVITGVGKINMVVAIAELSTLYPPKGEDILVNYGSCAAKDWAEGSIFMCNKIIEERTTRTFYPDMLYRHPFMEGCLYTVEKEKQENLADDGIYDMEAAAFYQGAAFYYGPHQMLFLKVVTDHGDIYADDPKAFQEQFSNIMNRAGEEIAAYLDEKIQTNIQEEEWKLAVQETDFEDRVKQLAEDLHCSKTMEATVRQLMRYWKLAGIDVNTLLAPFYDSEKLPCKDKREGSRILNEIRTKWL